MDFQEVKNKKNNLDISMMEITTIISRHSNTNLKRGCVITDSENRIISSGFDEIPDYIKSSKNIEYSDLITSAELNAIFNSTGSLRGSSAYVTTFPNTRDLTSLLHKGIRSIYYMGECSDSLVSEFLLDNSNISVKQIFLK